MKIAQVNSKQIQFFSLGTLIFCLGLGWFSLWLALMGFFWTPLIGAYLLLGLAYFFYRLVREREKSGNFWKSEFFLISGLLLVSVVFFSLWSAPTIFSGRDQGSLSEAAIRLVQNKSLAFSFPASEEFFKIYGPGRALNFPGFNYTSQGELMTQFFPGYISWLAAFFSLLGLKGFALANGLSFFVFLASFYLVVRRFLDFGPAFASLFLVLSTFIFSWFIKFTLSENLAWALLWFGLLQLLIFFQKKEENCLFYTLISFGLLIFVRVEGWFFLLMIGIILLFYARKEKKSLATIFSGKNSLVLFLIFMTFLWSFVLNQPAYWELAKGMAKPLIFIQREVTSVQPLSLFFYVLKILNNYLLLGFIAFSFLGVILLILRKKFLHLIPFLVVVPTFFYLIQPGISLDHPWMLRRFSFSVIPAAILYSVFFFESIFQKKSFFYGVVGLFFLGNLWVAFPLLKFTPEKELFSQVAEISRNFSKEDLILVDREATGSGWSMMTGPLSFIFGKQAVYFFNPEDIFQIDQKKFSNVYLIIPQGKLPFYTEELTGRISYVKDYEIWGERLEEQTVEKNRLEKAKITLPKVKNFLQKGSIYKLEK